MILNLEKRSQIIKFICHITNHSWNHLGMHPWTIWNFFEQFRTFDLKFYILNVILQFTERHASRFQFKTIMRKHNLIICKNLFLLFIQNFTQKLKSLPSISISLPLKSRTWKLTISKLNINSLFLWMILVTRRPEHIRDDNIHHIPILIFNLFEKNISIVKTIFTDLYFYRNVKTLIFFFFLWRVHCLTFV